MKTATVKDSGANGTAPAREVLESLETVEWNFRAELPSPKPRTVRVRVAKVADYPFVTRPDPRD